MWEKNHLLLFSASLEWLTKGTVNGAKTPERWQAELRAGMERTWAVDHGLEVEPSRWRRHWSEIDGGR